MRKARRAGAAGGVLANRGWREQGRLRGRQQKTRSRSLTRDPSAQRSIALATSGAGLSEVVGGLVGLVLALSVVAAATPFLLLIGLKRERAPGCWTCCPLLQRPPRAPRPLLESWQSYGGLRRRKVINPRPPASGLGDSPPKDRRTLDPNNSVVQLCAEGMQAESDGDAGRAAELFREAWDAAGDPYERCIAAHYVARHQANESDRLLWNHRSLDEADLVGDDRVEGLYPSLLLNLGHSLEMTGDRERAREHYARADEHCGNLPDGPYADLVRGGIAAGLERVRDVGSGRSR